MAKEKVEFTEVGTVDIIPERDWILHCPPEAVEVVLKQGVKATVNKRFVHALTIEGVISKKGE